MPSGLQRRFSIGLILPLAVFAGRGLARVILPTIRRRWRPLVLAAAFILIAPSMVLAIGIPTLGIASRDKNYYVTNSEQDGLDWLGENAPSDAIVLASPSYSLYIPVYGRSRVVYGHPFETVQADERREAVLDFYEGKRCDVVADEGVDYIVYGLREFELGDGCAPDAEPVFSSGDVSIYQAGG